MDFAAFQGERAGPFGAKQRPIDPFQKRTQPRLVWSPKDDHTGPFRRGKLPIIDIVSVQGDKRPPELPGEPIMLDVPRSAEILVLEHKQDIPVQTVPHIAHDAGRNVRVSVNSRLIDDPTNVWTKLAR